MHISVTDIKRGLTTGGVMYNSADSALVTVAGTANMLLQSNATSAPTWTATPTLSRQRVAKAETTTETSLHRRFSCFG